MLPGLVIREARPADVQGLSTLLETSAYIHRHLDWRPALDWLGHAPFLLIEQKGKILAALACPTDPPGIAWIRLFAHNSSFDIEAIWEALYKNALAFYRDQPQTSFAGIALVPWFGELLKSQGFHLHQEIVILEWDNVLPPPIRKPDAVTIQPMELYDVPDVTGVDNSAFAPLWQNSKESLRLAWKQSAYATIAKIDGKIVGYQISTVSGYSAHLARLAVCPEQQKKSLGYLLVQDLLEHFSKQDIFRVTVNTQNNNQASLALYQKLGFWPTGERFPVFLYP